jgi:hypothetical protein
MAMIVMSGESLQLSTTFAAIDLRNGQRANLCLQQQIWRKLQVHKYSEPKMLHDTIGHSLQYLSLPELRGYWPLLNVHSTCSTGGGTVPEAFGGGQVQARGTVV